MNDTISELKSPLIQDEFCSIEDSPFYIHKVSIVLDRSTLLIIP